MRESSYAVANAFAVLVVLIPIFDNWLLTDIQIYAKKHKMSPLEIAPEDYEPLTLGESRLYRLKASICDVFSIQELINADENLKV